MGTLYISTTGSITNSGCTDTAAALLSGAAATVAGAVVTLDGSPDLSGLVTSGATQSTIFIADASNSNQKIFWVTAVDNVLKTVDVTPSPTGVVSSAWKIGGRFYLGATGSPQNTSIEAALRAGDTAIINDSPSPQAAVIWTFRNAGNNSSGFAKIIGKTGVRPVLNTTNTSSVVVCQTLSWLENVECDQDGASGDAITPGTACVIYNVKVSDAGTGGIATAAGMRVIGCEITGTGANGIGGGGASAIIVGNYIHDLIGNGINPSSAGPTWAIIGNIIARCTGRGINLPGAASSSAGAVLTYGNTIYGCGNSGFEVADADMPITMFNDIFANNGDAAGEANIEWVAGTAELTSIHGYNTIYSPTGVAPINFTPNSQIPASEFITNPLLVIPGGGNFAIAAGSPALNTGFPGVFLGGLTTGTPSQGAVAPALASGSGDVIDQSITIRMS